jgi:hypothetical protein
VAAGACPIGIGAAEILLPEPDKHEPCCAAGLIEKSQRGVLMAEKAKNQYRSLTREELEEIAGEALPERAAMSLVNANVAIPINLALAANVLSDNAIAVADAAQDAGIDQGT